MNKKLPLKYIVPFVLALVLLVFTTVNGTRAALIYSNNYDYRFEMFDIGIQLEEKGQLDEGYKAVGYRNYYSGEKKTQEPEVTPAEASDETPAEEESSESESKTGTWVTDEIELLSADSMGDFVVGKTYDEHLRVTNSGTIDEYVRVRVYKYWMTKDASGEYVKNNTLDPNMIEITFTDDTDNWYYDDSAETKERSVLYYKRILSSGESTPDFVTAIRVKNDVIDYVKKNVVTNTVDGKTYTDITYIYKYDGAQFCLKVEADAIQTHNAANAITSVWGVTAKQKGINVE